MKKEEFEKLGGLQRVIYTYVVQAVENDEYQVELTGTIFEADDYVGGFIIIGGFPIRCSFNQKGFICWHCDEALSSLLNYVPDLQKKAVAKVKAIVKENQKELRAKRIKELQDEIKKLKKSK